MGKPLFTIITGNQHKLAEFRRLIPPALPFDHLGLDLDEIQSMDLDKIIEHKVRQAYELVKKPVVVEDVSAGLDELNGLPGPFIKYFEEKLGRDALYRLSSGKRRATITCTIAYFDGQKLYTCDGVIKGSVVPMTTAKGFGFDDVFVPDGQDQTLADMGPAGKDKISHRAIAVAKLVKHLSA